MPNAFYDERIFVDVRRIADVPCLFFSKALRCFTAFLRYIGIYIDELLEVSTHFGWDRVNFLHSSCVLDLCWKFVQGFFSYCWAGVALSQSWFCSWHSLFQWGGRGCRDAWREDNQDRGHPLITNIFQIIGCGAQHQNSGREVGGASLGIGWWGLTGHWLVGGEQLFILYCQEKILDFIFTSLCLGFFLTYFFLCLSYLLYCFYFTPEFSSVLPFFYPSDSLPSTEGEWVSYCIGLSCSLGLNHNNGLKNTCVILQANCILVCKGQKSSY